jgi:hypothetical protein
MAGRLTSALAIVLFIALAFTLPALAIDSPVIDGNYDDWADKPIAIDQGGADDETSPAKSDITQGSAFADTNGMYLLMAWDDTSFTGGNASTAGTTIHIPSAPPGAQHYRIYGTAEGAGFVPPTSIEFVSCSDASCGTETPVCSGTGVPAPCTGLLAASNPPTLPDPFYTVITHTVGKCSSGTDCLSYDSSMELFIPWTLVGGPPPAGNVTWFDFSSYPSGPGQGPKDNLGPIGITCVPGDPTYSCYVSTPTAVQFAGGRVGAASDYVAPVALACGLIVLTGLAVVWRRKH